MAPDIRNLKASSLVEKWQKASVVRKNELDLEESDAKIKRTELGKGPPKVKLPLWKGRANIFNLPLPSMNRLKTSQTMMVFMKPIILNFLN